MYFYAFKFSLHQQIKEHLATYSYPVILYTHSWETPMYLLGQFPVLWSAKPSGTFKSSHIQNPKQESPLGYEDNTGDPILTMEKWCFSNKWKFCTTRWGGQEIQLPKQLPEYMRQKWGSDKGLLSFIVVYKSLWRFLSVAQQDVKMLFLIWLI